MIDERWEKVRRVLVVRLDNLGDVLVTSPAIHAIKESLPDASITLLASPVGAQVGELNPDISTVLTYKVPWVDPWQQLPQNSEREQRMIAVLKAERFDGAIIFSSFRQSSLPAAYLCYLADIPLRVAASTDGPGSLLTTRHRFSDQPMHEVERQLDLVAAIGFRTNARDLVLQVPNEARSIVASSYLATKMRRPLVVVHPGCSMPSRTYPWELYAKVADLLVERIGATIVLTGTREEQETVERILDRMRPKNRYATYMEVGRLSFGEFCALIEMADLTITNNTGPMHISAAVKTPVIALYALTTPPYVWRPWNVPHHNLYHDVPCRHCYTYICPYHQECLRLVTPETVITAAEDLLAARPSMGIQ